MSDNNKNISGSSSNRQRSGYTLLIVLCTALLSLPAAAKDAQVLSSWRDGEVKSAIIQFVSEVTDPTSADFIPPQQRIVVTDNDGTLWVEKPLYPQVAFLFDQVHRQAGQIDTSDELLSAVLDKNYGYFRGLDKQPLLEGLLKPQVGTDIAEYQGSGLAFLQTAIHPKYAQPMVRTIYQPMVELIDFLRANQFSVYIVTGGGEDFVRGVSEALYGIPAERVLGTQTHNTADNQGQSVRKGNKLVAGMNEGMQKVTRIEQHIGAIPVIAIGNSTGDLEMLAHTDSRPGRSLALLLKHDDSVREYAYDKGAEKAQQMAKASGWLTVSMQRDFAEVFGFAVEGE